MFGLDEINKQKEKDYRSIQKRIDSDPKYRESFIKEREMALERVHRTGYASNIDNFLCDSFFMTLLPAQRDDFFEKYGKRISLIEFLKL
jgi:hypothetical protein